MAIHIHLPARQVAKTVDAKDAYNFKPTPANANVSGVEFEIKKAERFLKMEKPGSPEAKEWEAHIAEMKAWLVKHKNKDADPVNSSKVRMIARLEAEIGRLEDFLRRAPKEGRLGIKQQIAEAHAKIEKLKTTKDADWSARHMGNFRFEVIAPDGKKTSVQANTSAEAIEKVKKGTKDADGDATTFFEGSVGQFKADVKRSHPDAVFTESQFRGGRREITAKVKGETVGGIQELPTGKFRGGWRKKLRNTKDALSVAEAERELRNEIRLIEVYTKSGRPVPVSLLQRKKMLEEEVERVKAKTGDVKASKLYLGNYEGWRIKVKQRYPNVVIEGTRGEARAKVPGNGTVAEYFGPLDGRLAWIDAVDQTSDASFPAIVTFKGERYSKTGKVGKRFDTGEETAEYRLEAYGMGTSKMDKRVWRTASGKVTQDAK